MKRIEYHVWSRDSVRNLHSQWKNFDMAQGTIEYVFNNGVQRQQVWWPGSLRPDFFETYANEIFKHGFIVQVTIRDADGTQVFRAPRYTT